MLILGLCYLLFVPKICAASASGESLDRIQLNRAMAEELEAERGRLPQSSDQSDHDLSLHAEMALSIPRYRNK